MIITLLKSVLKLNRKIILKQGEDKTERRGD